MGVQDINTLLGIGGLQQQQGQRQLDVDRANTLAQQALPYQQIGFMSDIFRGVPKITTNLLYNYYSTSKSNITMLGLGIAGLGAAGAAGGFSNLFSPTPVPRRA